VRNSWPCSNKVTRTVRTASMYTLMSLDVQPETAPQVPRGPEFSCF
jgi:hypothetical protein